MRGARGGFQRCVGDDFSSLKERTEKKTQILKKKNNNKKIRSVAERANTPSPAHPHVAILPFIPCSHQRKNKSEWSKMQTIAGKLCVCCALGGHAPVDFASCFVPRLLWCCFVPFFFLSFPTMGNKQITRQYGSQGVPGQGREEPRCFFPYRCIPILPESFFATQNQPPNPSEKIAGSSGEGKIRANFPLRCRLRWLFGIFSLKIARTERPRCALPRTAAPAAPRCR